MEATAIARPYLLLVDDNPADAQLVREAIAGAGLDVELEHVVDGESGLDAVARVMRRAQRPSSAMILLDLGLPGIGGMQVLRQFKQFPTTKCLPVVVFSSDSDPETIRRALVSHANAYLLKNGELDAYMASVSTTVRAFLYHLQSPFGASPG